MQNFGRIHNEYKNILVESILEKDAEKKKLFQDYIKSIKESVILTTQFMVYNNIESKIEENDSRAYNYVKENIALLSKFDSKDIFKENAKVVLPILDEDYAADGDYENKELHENITKLIFTEKNPKTINNITESTNKIVDYIKVNVIEENVEATMPSGVIGSMAVKKYNEKYSDLSEEEKTVLKTIIESDNEGKENLYNNLRNECVDLVDVQLTESEDKEKLLQVKDKLLRLEYKEESFVTDITRVMELKNSLTDNG